ncbi:PAS domain-containing protein [Fibrobacterota bacterium]
MMAEPGGNEKKLNEKVSQLEANLVELEREISRLRQENRNHSKDRELIDSFMDNIPDSIYFKDRQGRFTYVNKACIKKHHFKDMSEALGKTDFDLFTADHAKPAYEDEQLVITSGKPIVCKEELETWESGNETWASTTKVPLLNKRGKIIGTFGLSRDITSLKQSELRLQTLMDNIPDNIYFKDEESRFIMMNRACARRFGLDDPDDAVGKTDFDFFSEEHAKPAYDDERKVIETDEPIIGKEELETWPDGRVTWASTTKMPLHNNKGEIIGTFGLSRDITRIKVAEQRLQTLMDNIPDAIYFKDEQSRFILANRTCAIKVGIENPSELIGKSDLDFFTEETAGEWVKAERRIVETGEAIINQEFTEPGSGGDEEWISTTKMPFRNHKGDIVGTFGVSRNISRLKRAEIALQKSNENLEKIVAQRTEELRKANEGMKIRIQQLDYLNKKARFFTQLIDRDTLLPAIFYAFVERFPNGEVHLCEMRQGTLKTAYNTEGLKDGDNLSACIRALEYLETDKEGDVFMEGDWTRNSLLKDLFSDSMKNLPCYLVVPLITDMKLRGAVQIFAPMNFRDIYDQENTVINTLAAQSAMSLDNANNYRQLSERARIQSELEIAQGIQKRFTPEDPMIPKLKIKGVCRPASEVGGDYLDFFQNNLGDWVLVIADVCGKGIPAALVMTSLRSIIRTEAREQDSSKALLCAVNSLMGRELQLDNSFITCMAIIVSRDGESMNFTRAGHPLLISYNSNRKPRMIPAPGIALGMLLGEQFESVVEEVHLDLKSGDRFLAYTDGLDEAMNFDKETYGLKRLFGLLTKSQNKKPEELVATILQDLEDFCGGQRQYDDLTLFAMERL